MFSGTGAIAVQQRLRVDRRRERRRQRAALLDHRADPVRAVRSAASSRPSAPGSRATDRGRDRTGQGSPAASPRASRAQIGGVAREGGACAARRRGPRRSPRRTGTCAHLWKSNATESARSMPAQQRAQRGDSIAMAPNAPSTWNHSSSRAQRSASAGEVVDRAGVDAAGGADDQERRDSRRRGPRRCRAARAATSMRPRVIARESSRSASRAEAGHVQRARDAAMRRRPRRRRRAAPRRRPSLAHVRRRARRCGRPAPRPDSPSRCR